MNKQLTIIQHNVMHWNTSKYSLIDNYCKVLPDIILLNSHGVKSNETITIAGYKIGK